MKALHAGSILLILTCWLLLAPAAGSAAVPLPVIPGAVGFGIATPAGRGGTVYKVTSLADDPRDPAPGTLRYAINQPEPRIIVFEVSGTIQMDSVVAISNPYVTIAGQTAPSPGIFLRGAVLSIETHDVLIQHIRIAPGDDLEGVETNNRDCFSVAHPSRFPTNVVVDHVTCTWSVDELFSIWYEAGDVTFRHILAAEPLHDSIHLRDESATETEPHGFGPLFYNGTRSRVTFTGNLISHCADRMPFSGASKLVMVNNVLYDPLATATKLHSEEGWPSVNSIVGNVYLQGLSLAGWAKKITPIELSPEFHQLSRVYLADNQAPALATATQWELVVNKSPWPLTQFRTDLPPVWNDGLVAKPAGEVMEWVVANAGARPADRLPYEKRIVDNTLHKTGRIVNSLAEIGGWPEVEQNYRALVVPENPHGDDDGDGYSNIEEWLHQWAAEVEGTAGREPATAVWDIERVTRTPLDMDAVVTAPLEFDLQLRSAQPVPLREVRCIVDGREIYVGAEPPRDLWLNRGELSDGRHTLMVALTDKHGWQQYYWREFKVDNMDLQIIPPGDKTGPQAVAKIATFLPAESIRSVRAYIDDKQFFAGDAAPVDLMIDTLALSDGEYKITAQITTEQGAISQDSALLLVKNRWESADELLPPLDSWWGIINRDATSHRSAGWVYAPDAPDDARPTFRADIITRQQDSDEYLEWATPKLERFSVTLLVRDTELLRFVTCAVSADGSNWTFVPYSVAEASMLGSGWHKLELQGAAPEKSTANHFRLAVQKMNQPDTGLYIDRVKFSRFAPWVTP